MSLSKSYAPAAGWRLNLRVQTRALSRRAALLAGGALAFGLCILAQGRAVDHALDDWHGNVAASQPAAHQIR